MIFQGLGTTDSKQRIDQNIRNRTSAAIFGKGKCPTEVNEFRIIQFIFTSSVIIGYNF